MVKLTEDQIYGALSYEWQSGRDVINNLTVQLGLDRLTPLQKIVYLAGFQLWTINQAWFNVTVSKLKDDGLVETDDRREEIDGGHCLIRYVRKKVGGVREKSEREAPQGSLELGLQSGL